MSLTLEVVLSVVRYALGVAFGVLVARGIVAPDLAHKVQTDGATWIATWIVTFALPLVWIWLKNSKIVKSAGGAK